MKTSVLSMVAKGLCVGVLATFLVSCGEKTQQVTGAKDEPKWVNSRTAQEEAGRSVAVATASSQVLNDNLNFATNQAVMKARAALAQEIQSSLQDVTETLGISGNESQQQATRQKVELSLQTAKMMERWVDKSKNPNEVHVLVSMEKDAYEQAKKAALEGYKLKPEEVKKVSDSIDDMLRRGDKKQQ